MLGKLSVKIVGASILMFTQLLLLQDIGEFLLHQVRFLFVENISFSRCIVKPRMIEHLFGGKARSIVLLQHALHEIAC